MSQPRIFKHWVYLNDEGKELFGDIFPDGIVPVLSIVPHVTAPDGNDAYLVYHEELTLKQRDKLIQKLAQIFHGTTSEVIDQMEKDRIPIRTKLTKSSGTDGLAYFI
jgi:hypothetical protein